MSAAPSAGRGWFDLPWNQQRAVLAMFWLVPVLHVAVRIVDYHHIRTFLDRRANLRRTRVTTPPADVEPYRLATSRITCYSWLPGNCLSRSLALCWLLRRNGHDAELRLGVSLAGGAFAAHAWVELEGCVLNDSQDVTTRYAPIHPPLPLQPPASQPPG